MREHCNDRCSKYVVKAEKMKCIAMPGFISLKASVGLRICRRIKFPTFLNATHGFRIDGGDAHRGGLFIIDPRKMGPRIFVKSLFYYSRDPHWRYCRDTFLLDINIRPSGIPLKFASPRALTP